MDNIAVSSFSSVITTLQGHRSFFTRRNYGLSSRKVRRFCTRSCASTRVGTVFGGMCNNARLAGRRVLGFGSTVLVMFKRVS